MQRILKIIRKDTLMKEHKYAVFYPEGLIVFNGIFGIRYSMELLGAHLPKLIEEWGSFAVYDAQALRQSLKLLGDVSEVFVSEIENDNGFNLVFKFKGGKGKLILPITLDLPRNLEHFLIQWPEYNAEDENAIIVDDSWNDFKSLITPDGQSLWPNSYGVYGDDKKLKSFDSTAYIESNANSAVDFFCPSTVIALGLGDIDYALPSGNGLFLIGKDVQYYTTKAIKNEAITDTSEVARLFDDVEAFDTFEIEIDKSAQTWARAREFVDGKKLIFAVQDSKIIIANEKWEEEIGSAGKMPNITFTIPLNLVERWVQHTIGHEISRVDGKWYLRGRTLRGFSFVARLSSSSSYEEQGVAIDNGDGFEVGDDAGGDLC